MITRIISWLLFFYPLAWFTATGKYFSFDFTPKPHNKWFLLMSIDPVATAILSGLLVLAISHLLQYLLEENSKETFLVRHGDKTFYLYILVFLIPFLSIFSVLPKPLDVLLTWSFWIPSFLTIGVKVSLLILSGMFFKRLVESVRQVRAINSQG
jgi:hypothetical protein